MSEKTYSRSGFFGRTEFWILLFFLIRLIGVTNAPLEVGHNWRQVTGLMVSRNFLEVDPNILYPRVDDNHGETGIIGMEFPLMNYLYFLMAKVFGYQHWYGRLINLVVSSLGVWFFGKLIEKYFTRRIALASVICLLGSIWFAFSRKMMPDTFCISLMFAGVYFGSCYLRNGGAWRLLLYLIFASAAVLSKIPAGIYLVVLIPVAFYEKQGTRTIVCGLFSVIPLILAYCWYFIWNPHLSETYGVWYNSGKNFAEGLQEITSNMGMVLKNFYFSAFAGYLFFAVFLVGLFFIVKRRQKALGITVSLLFLVFLVYMIKSGFFFYHHNYYIIPFVPVMALVAGYAVSLVRQTWMYVSVLILATVESVANQQHDFFIKNSEKYKLQLEQIADKVSSKDDLIGINGGDNPQQIYLSHRKGWTFADGQLRENNFLLDLKKKECKFIFVNKHSFSGSIPHQIVFENPDYAVYALE